MEIAPGIWQVAAPTPQAFLSAVNLYLIRDPDGFVLVDAGLGTEATWDAVSSYLAGMGASAGAIHTVIATHAHPDHVGLVPELRNRLGARIWLHERDLTYLRTLDLDNPPTRQTYAAWLRRHGFPPDEISPLLQTRDMRWATSAALAADRALTGGEELSIGNYRFQLHWTPGHTPGHLCLYEPHRRLLISGDHVLHRVTPNVSLQPSAPEDVMGRYLRSLERMRGWTVDLCLPGHGAPFTNFGERAGQLLRLHQEKRSSILALLGPSPRTPYELASRIWADAKPVPWAGFVGFVRRNAVGTVAAHLEVLARAGRVSRVEDEAIRFVRAS